MVICITSPLVEKFLTFEDPATLFPISLKIEITKEEFQEEIQQCINYLQRQRSPDLAVCVLQLASNLYKQRETIMNMLLTEYTELVSKSIGDEKGFVIKCSHKGKSFFKSTWKISFDCYIGCPYDCLDFIVNRKDTNFYNSVVTYMKLLTQISLPFERKEQFWKGIMENITHSLSTAVDNEVLDDCSSNETITGQSSRSTLERSCDSCSNNFGPVIELESSDDSCDDGVVVVE